MKQDQHSDFQTKPGFVERRMTQGRANNSKMWKDIYDEYSNDQYPPFGGPFTNALTFIEWLQLHYNAPERIEWNGPSAPPPDIKSDY